MLKHTVKISIKILSLHPTIIVYLFNTTNITFSEPATYGKINGRQSRRNFSAITILALSASVPTSSKFKAFLLLNSLF